MKSGNSFLRGFRAGLPIGLGYFSVSLSFGILAVSYGFSWWQAVLISMVTVTSAGQFSGISTMCYPGQYLAMLVSQLTINIRYSMMGVSLSQKTDGKFTGICRWLLGFFITDEIFAVAVAEPTLRRSFFAGLAVLPYMGWALGTLMGAVLGNFLPARLMNALCVALYGMFVAIVLPETKKSCPMLIVVLLAAALSCLFTWLPLLQSIPSGISVSLCAVIAAAVGAAIWPMKKEDM